MMTPLRGTFWRKRSKRCVCSKIDIDYQNMFVPGVWRGFGLFLLPLTGALV